MIAAGLLVYVVACWLAFASVALRGGRALALVTCALAVLAYGLWLLGTRMAEHVPPRSVMRQVQVAVILAHGITIALIPSGLARQLRSRRWAPSLALILAVAWPFLGLLASAMLGRPVADVSGGWGSLGELHFLDPVEMGEGVTSAGLIPFRFRIHHVAMYSMALLGVLLHLLPVRQRTAQRREGRKRPAEWVRTSDPGH